VVGRRTGHRPLDTVDRDGTQRGELDHPAGQVAAADRLPDRPVLRHGAGSLAVRRRRRSATDVIRPARSPVAGLSATLRNGLRTPRLTFAGRFSQDKGPDVLLEAICLLNRRDLSAYLLGDGPLRARLTDRLHQRGVSSRVFMPGWVDKPWTYIAGSAVHVVPSREEAWSQSAVLGLGLGVPVVGTHVDGLADTLSQSRGVTVAPDDRSL